MDHTDEDFVPYYTEEFSAENNFAKAVFELISEKKCYGKYKLDFEVDSQSNKIKVHFLGYMSINKTNLGIHIELDNTKITYFSDHGSLDFNVHKIIFEFNHSGKLANASQITLESQQPRTKVRGLFKEIVAYCKHVVKILERFTYKASITFSPSICS